MFGVNNILSKPTELYHHGAYCLQTWLKKKTSLFSTIKNISTMHRITKTVECRVWKVARKANAIKVDMGGASRWVSVNAPAFAGTKLYFLVTEAYGSQQLA